MKITKPVIKSAAAGAVVLFLMLFHPAFTAEHAWDKKHPQVLKVQQIYTSQIGIREKGYNAGEQVEAYLQYVSLSKGNPWCAAFVCWVFGQAGVQNPRTGWSPLLFPTSKVIWDRTESKKQKAKSNWQQITGNPRPIAGDIFALYFPEKKRIAHTGFIDQWDDRWLITVEGNTNQSGSREGDGVYRKRRLVSSIYQVARYIHSARKGGS